MSIVYDYEHAYNYDYMNLYITEKNQELLRQEESMSGLVNQLLEEHYSGEYITVPQYDGKPILTVEPKQHAALHTEIAPTPPQMGFACCLSKTKRCKHWEFDDLHSCWTNTINGVSVDA